MPEREYRSEMDPRAEGPRLTALLASLRRGSPMLWAGGGRAVEAGEAAASSSWGWRLGISCRIIVATRQKRWHGRRITESTGEAEREAQRLACGLPVFSKSDVVEAFSVLFL